MARARALRHVAVALATIGGLSCGELGPTAPAATAPKAALSPQTRTVVANQTYLDGTAKGTAIRWGASHVASDERVSALIGPEGGWLVLKGSDFIMIIPRGALATETLITVTSKGGPHVAYDMQPHGIVFLKPVVVVQHLRQTALYGTSGIEGIRSAYLSPGNEEIASDDSALPAELTAGTTFYSATGVAEAHLWYLSHFSRYILISGVWVVEEEPPEPLP